MSTDKLSRRNVVPLTHTQEEERHVWDYVRVVYKRRWAAIPAFVIVFLIGAINSFRTTPLYQATTQLLIEKDAPKVGSLNTMFQEQDGWYNDDFYQTQYRILQSRSLARKAAELMNLPRHPSVVRGLPQGRGPISLTGAAWNTASWLKRTVTGGGPAETARRR
jgi:uncharacterized protein involved in exopolysaccharide biosynthesis